jgi:hypothetical protein
MVEQTRAYERPLESYRAYLASPRGRGRRPGINLPR